MTKEERKLFCSNCMSEQLVHIHPNPKDKNVADIICHRCQKKIAELIKNALDQWDLNTDFYSKGSILEQ